MLLQTFTLLNAASLPPLGISKSNELRRFNLSSFMSDRSLEYAFQKTDKDIKFFSVYIFMERLEDDLWEDDRYMEKEEVHCTNIVSTYFFTYDSRNRFIFHREEKNLWLNFFDLVGNFHIDRKESEGILKDVVKIRDKFQSIPI